MLNPRLSCLSRKLRKTLLWLALFLWPVAIGTAQTLTEKLVQEDPQQLLREARESGDVVRGAILFHQGNINCVRCHRGQPVAHPIGPDIRAIDRDQPDSYLVESILQPSKVIKEGFETLVALMLDGRVVRGTRYQESDEQLVLRDLQDPERLIVLKREDIDDVRPDTTSSMPAELADQLRDRKQFLDLLSYVLELRQQGPRSADAESGLDRQPLPATLQGWVAIQRYRCTACHAAPEQGFVAAPAQGPRLAWSAAHLSPAQLVTFLKSPHQSQPGTRMPDMLAQLPPNQRDGVAQALVHFLTAESPNQFASTVTDAAAAKRGETLYHSVGCVACHGPRRTSAESVDSSDLRPLNQRLAKFDVASLTAFLEDPLVARPSGHMPQMQLRHREAEDLSHYLLTPSQGDEIAVPGSAWQVDPQQVAAGRQWYQKLNCARCHEPLAGPATDEAKALPLNRLSPNGGCLGEPGSRCPSYDIGDEERGWIQALLSEFPPAFEPQQQVTATLAEFRCLSCHRRNEFGGVTQELSEYFHTTNENLGQQGRIPPTLTGVGAKLQPEWMRDVLVNQRSIRPYMETRMPQFGEENIGHLVGLLGVTDTLEAPPEVPFEDQKEMRELGLKLAGNQGLNCVACHTYKFEGADTMPAVDLTEMAQRLKKDWFHRYMLAPQTYSPNTVMPSFWPGGKAIRKDLPGPPEYQVEALWQYLIDGRQANAPRGVVREPLEIVVTDQPRLLRRSYPGIGKRGIGIGYPGGINLAFDAFQMRLATVWKGGFVDPGGVWTGQGSGTARPLGRSISLMTGPELDLLASPRELAEGERPPHHFDGYQLDAKRQPTLMYRLDEVHVQDHFEPWPDPQSGQLGLRRTLRFQSDQPRNDLAFRLGQGSDVSQQDEAAQRFRITGSLGVQILEGPQAQVIGSGDQQRLVVPLKLQAGENPPLILLYQWPDQLP